MKPKDIASALQPVPLKLQAGDKVWIVSVEGQKPRDVGATQDAQQALRRIVSQRDKAAIVESSAPALAALLDLYRMKPMAEIPDADLIKAARAAGATKALVFRARSLAPQTPGGVPFLPPSSAEEPMSLEARVIEVASGKVVAVAEVSTTTTAPPAETPSGRAYPLRVTDPDYVSRPDVPKRKEESDMLGRRYRAYSRMSDDLGPQGLYNNADYQEWTRTSDAISPFPLYSDEPTLLVITSTPPNARVFVNDMDMGLTPCWLSLDEGDKVVLLKEGFIQEELRVPAKPRAFHVNLRPR